jgi:hypothetical protein
MKKSRSDFDPLEVAKRLLKNAEAAGNHSGAAALLNFVHTVTKPQTPADVAQAAANAARNAFLEDLTPDENDELVSILDAMDAFRSRVLARQGRAPASRPPKPVVAPVVAPLPVVAAPEPEPAASDEPLEPEREDLHAYFVEET